MLTYSGKNVLIYWDSSKTCWGKTSNNRKFEYGTPLLSNSSIVPIVR